MAKYKKPAKQASPFCYQYAAKFLCTATIPGTSQTAASLPAGSYSTIVNIHNPQTVRVKYRMKIAVPGLKPSKFISKILGPDYAAKVGCEQITRDFGLTFIHGAEGFLVIESTDSFAA